MVAERSRIHAAGGVDGDGPHGGRTEAESHGGLLDRVVAMLRGEENEGPVGCAAVALRLGSRVERVPRNDHRGEVGGAPALAGDAAGARAVKTE